MSLKCRSLIIIKMKMNMKIINTCIVIILSFLCFFPHYSHIITVHLLSIIVLITSEYVRITNCYNLTLKKSIRKHLNLNSHPAFSVFKVSQKLTRTLFITQKRQWFKVGLPRHFKFQETPAGKISSNSGSRFSWM